MKLWLIWQNVNNGYDTYDSAVVSAENEEAARLTPPTEGIWSVAWTNTENVSVRLLGEAIEGAEAGVILASFNAG